MSKMDLVPPWEEPPDPSLVQETEGDICCDLNLAQWEGTVDGHARPGFRGPEEGTPWFLSRHCCPFLGTAT